MDERAIFHTEYGVGISSLHPQTLGVQYLLKQSSQCSSVCLSEDKSLIFVSFKDKAIINTYKIQENESLNKGSSANKTGEIPVLQRLPTPEPLTNLVLVKNNYLIGSAVKPTRTLIYVYDLSSGSLINTVPMGKVHYNPINKIKFMESKNMVITMADDGRFVLWSFLDLLNSSEDDIKPVSVFNDHQGVGVKDVVFDKSESVLLSTGDDGTVCCYNFVSNYTPTKEEQKPKHTVDHLVLVSKFTFPQAVLQFDIDHAGRFAICVLKNAEIWELPLIYSMGQGKISNLHSLPMQGNSNKNKVSLYNCTLEKDLDLSNDTLMNLLRRGIISCRLIAKGANTLKISMDSTGIVMGRKKVGQSCLFVDISTSQVIKDIGTPLGLNVRSDTSQGIFIDEVYTLKLNQLSSSKAFISDMTLPNLSKVVENNHKVNLLNDPISTNKVSVVGNDFEKYIREHVRTGCVFNTNERFDDEANVAEQTEFVTKDYRSDELIEQKNKEIEELKQQVERLSKAYNELSEMV